MVLIFLNNFGTQSLNVLNDFFIDSAILPGKYIESMHVPYK